MKERSFRGWLKRSAVWLTLIPVLLSMWVIFGFSAQPAEQSNQTSSRVADMVIRLFVPDFEQMDAARQAELTGHLTLIVRKTAHALEYAMLGFFLYLHVWSWHDFICRLVKTEKPAPRRIRLPWWIWSLPIGVLYAVTDEIHQGFVADRAPRAVDVGVDTVGVIAGMAACALLLLIVRRIGEHREKRSTQQVSA